MSAFSCPVCRFEGHFFSELPDKGRSFLLCPECSLVYQESTSLPDAHEEKNRYELHKNNPEDKGYTRWLQSFIDQGVTPWYRGGSVLDFGSGPRPVLTGMLQNQGFDVFCYDPFFAPRWPEEETFSLILLCEVLEHIHDPVSAFRRLFESADEGAFLSIKTLFLPSMDKMAFKNWWYKEDPTHIRFFSPSSLLHLGEKSGWRLVHHDSTSLAVFEKR